MEENRFLIDFNLRTIEYPLHTNDSMILYSIANEIEFREVRSCRYEDLSFYAVTEVHGILKHSSRRLSNLHGIMILGENFASPNKYAEESKELGHLLFEREED